MSHASSTLQRIAQLARPLAVTFLCAFAVAAGAAPLDESPGILREKAEHLRNMRELPWDPATGRLGNLRHVNIVAPDCTVRIVGGPDNRVFAGRVKVGIADGPSVRQREPGKGPVARNLVISVLPAETGSAIPRIGEASGPVCFTLQVATAHSFILGGDNLKVLVDRLELPVVDVYLNPSIGLKLWLRDVRIGMLRVDSNATATAGGTGQVERLSLKSSQGTSALLFHDMDARFVGVEATTTGARFSIRIGSGTQAGYYQGARAPGKLALHYPIWIDGPVGDLKVPVGQVNAMSITDAIRSEARTLRDDVLRSAGPMPELPTAEAVPPVSRAMREAVSPRQRVADVLQPFLPAGVTLARVELFKQGSALEGSAADEGAVRQFVENLKRSGEVRSPQVAMMRRESGRVSYRLLVSLLCDAPGDASMCLPGSGDAYPSQQLEDALRSILGPKLVLTKFQLGAEGMIQIAGRADEAEAKAAFDRIGTSARWVQASSTSIGNGNFSASLRLTCAIPPPREDGICISGKRVP